MRRNIICIFIFSVLVTLIYYLVKDYSVDYSINKVNVKEKYSNKRYYFLLDDKYQLDVYSNRKLSRKLINNVKKVADKNESCLILESKKLDVYPVCYKNNKQVSYDLIVSKKINKYFKNKKIVKENKKKNFEYFNNLDENVYIAVWKYNGFYIMNGKRINKLNIFKNDRYSNSLCTMYDKYIFVPNYDSEHVFSEYYKIDIKKGKYKKIKIPYSIDYDSYILGKKDEFIYLYDKKYKIQYEINMKKDVVNIIGSKEKGYIGYKAGRKVKSSWSMLDKNSSFTFVSDSNYIYNNDKYLVRKMKDNKKFDMVISKDKVDIVSEVKNKVYYLNNEYLYLFDPLVGSYKIVRNFEWNFNNKNVVFVYDK